MPNTIDPLYRHMSFIRKWLRWLLQPSATLVKSADRRDAQFLAALSLFMVGIFGPLLIVLLIAQDNTGVRIALTATVTTLAAYGLSRTPYHRFGTAVLILCTVIWTFELLTLYPSPLVATTTMLPIFLASLFWPSYVIFGGTALNLIWLNILLIAANVNTGDLLFLNIFIIVSGAMTVIITNLRRYDQRQIERQNQRLRQGEARLRAAIDGSLDSFLLLQTVYAANGEIVDFVVVDANPQTEQWLNLRRDALLGQMICGLIPPARRAATFEKYRQVVRGGRTLAEEYAEDNALGETIWHFHQVVPTADGVAVTNRDITNRKQSEAQQLEFMLERERSDLLRRFIDEVSHDIRTPLTIIKTSAQLLNRGLTPERDREHREQILTQADRLNKMVNDMLTMSRLDNPDERYDLHMLELNALTRRLTTDYAAIADRRRLLVTFEPAAYHVFAEADPTQLRVALDNLMDNALRFTPEGGHITLRTGSTAHGAFIEVQDTGNGIEQHILPRIFERFYRGEPHRPNNGSAGLGLSIAQRIIHAHRGTIEVVSKVNAGSTFRIVLPPLSESAQQPFKAKTVPNRKELMGTAKNK
ncbi:MAG: sensor histidine kinase [Chloroflexota bacterium]